MREKLSTNEILKRFPTLNPNTLDYLIRNKIISVIQRGKGIERIYTLDFLVDIETWLSKRNHGGEK